MAITGASLLGLGILNFWTALLVAAGVGVTDPYVEYSFQERFGGAVLLPVAAGGLPAVAGWWFWRQGPRLRAAAYPFGFLNLMRLAGQALLGLAALVQAVLPLAWRFDFGFYLALLPFSAPFVILGVTFFWLGAVLPPFPKRAEGARRQGTSVPRRRRSR